MENSVPSLLAEVEVRLQSLESKLCKQLDPRTVSAIVKLPWKALLYRETITWRMAELGRSALEKFEQDRLVSGIVLTRAAVETSAGLWYLQGKLFAAVDSKHVGDIDDYLMRLVAGMATDPPSSATPRPVRIGTFLNAVEKDIPGFSDQYGRLSEYAHPNWAGTGLLYSKHDERSRLTHFGQNIRKSENTKKTGLVNLSVTLRMFELSHDLITQILPAFTALCEKHHSQNQP